MLKLMILQCLVLSFIFGGEGGIFTHQYNMGVDTQAPPTRADFHEQRMHCLYYKKSTNQISVN